MKFWEKITGSEMTKEWKNYELRVKKLPADYQEAWERISEYLWQNSDFTGRNIMPILEGVLGLFEETSLEGLALQEVLGKDIRSFSHDLIGEENISNFREKWRRKLNKNIYK